MFHRVAIAAVAATVAPVALRGDSINLNGVVTITPDGTPGSFAAGSTACQDFPFSGTTIVNPVSPSSDSGIIGATVSLPGFGLGWNGTSSTFDPTMGAFSVSYGANSLSGEITWESIAGSGGAFAIKVGISNMVDTGTDPIFMNFASRVAGGILTFSLPSGPQNLSQLFASTTTQQTSLSGTLVTSVPFSAFSAKLEVSAEPPPGFQLNGAFTLGSASTGIDPLTQPVMLQVGTYSAIIPPGSFVPLRHGRVAGGWAFQGVIGGVTLQVQVAPVATGEYSIKVDASGVNLTSLTNPVTVVLTIGNNSGPSLVDAEFE
jgi:hypothetical protein